MKIEHDVNLRNYNTFHLNSIAKNLYIIEINEDLLELNNVFETSSYLILGGGSNILLSKEVYENVILINTKGIEIVSESDQNVDVKVSAGEIWHDFLLFLLSHNLYGLENLALIPGNCGTAPIQNIGAYGLEQEANFLNATAFDPILKRYIKFNKEQCNFNYRHSIFKRDDFKHLIITDVTYRLSKNFTPNLNYNELKKLDAADLTSVKLFNYICDLRKSKIPYPEEVGNAGSFFKNPIINKDKLEDLKNSYPELPHFSINDDFKLSAAWLIEKTGMKGKSLSLNSDAQVSDRHSLILINKGSAKGEELVQLSDLIIKRVKNMFDITLESEVNIF